ncbi:UMP-CMP kinase 2, mitochondrial-like [Macrosteles quadrilineatus]|uniref:UMP-CMP kinase 2, mitochondrial-like n=1 Tax=Macrosteles quadrilineatus TaxID=74068 RepID=UPI0023E1FA0B|nr:UMP-CMP kinase 2, mitochondrial-like [Macrosteles quadrilineatus]
MVELFNIVMNFVYCLFLFIFDTGYSAKVAFPSNPWNQQRTLIVFYSLRETLKTFEMPKFANDSKVQEVLYAFHNHCQLSEEEEQRLEALDNQSSIRRKPLIVVEGSDRDTRRIVAKKLSYNMKALLMRNPPTCLNPMRDYFHDNLVLRRAYFSLCMYAGAINVTRHWYNHTIILSAYWHDQATFSIAKKYSLRNMPPQNSPIYEWPEDLIPPDVEFFINTPQTKNDPDAPISMFHPRLVEAYRRMRNPTVFEISGSMYHDQIRFEMEIYLQKLYRENYQYIINTV